MVEKSGVEKFMVEKSGFERSEVEFWKVQGWDFIQTPQASLKSLIFHQIFGKNKASFSPKITKWYFQFGLNLKPMCKITILNFLK